jgi:hypothetical protein
MEKNFSEHSLADVFGPLYTQRTKKLRKNVYALAKNDIKFKVR